MVKYFLLYCGPLCRHHAFRSAIPLERDTRRPVIPSYHKSRMPSCSWSPWGPAHSVSPELRMLCTQPRGQLTSLRIMSYSLPNGTRCSHPSSFQPNGTVAEERSVSSIQERTRDQRSGGLGTGSPLHQQQPRREVPRGSRKIQTVERPKRHGGCFLILKERLEARFPWFCW